MEQEKNEIREAQKRWRDIKRQLKSGAAPDVSIGVAATFTAEPLLPYLANALVGAETKLLPDIRLAEYDSIRQVCMDPDGQIEGVPDILGVFWRIEDLAPSAVDACARGQAEAIEDVLAAIDELFSAVAHYDRTHRGLVVVSLPPLPRHPFFSSIGVDSRAMRRLYLHAQARAMEAIDALSERVIPLDLGLVESSVGLATSTDLRKQYLYRQPFSEAFYLQFGKQLARVMRSLRTPPRKCLSLDCDNTLWGGVLGEEGLAGIQLGHDFPGSAFRDLQRACVALRSRGVFLALCSKNNEEDVWEVFDKHDEMVLQRDHISAWRINWEPKFQNLQQIANDLNIGVDSLVFLDDSPFEIDQARTMVPEVLSILLPTDPSEFVRMLHELDAFDAPSVTAEDAKRADMFRAEQDRTRLQTEMDPQEYLASLSLRLDVHEAQEAHLARVHQLINKTNQFNLTTRRRTLPEVVELADDPSWIVLAGYVSDRFGEYGLTGVCLVRIEGEIAHIDTFLMSCRVLGRGIETGLLQSAADLARTRGASHLRGEFIPTQKNRMAEDFYPRHGFGGGEGKFEILIEDLARAPAHLDIRTSWNGERD